MLITSAQLLHGRIRSAADVSPAYAATLLHIRYTNRLFGYQRRCTKRLTITRRGRSARIKH